MEEKDLTGRLDLSGIHGAARVGILVVETDLSEAMRIVSELKMFGFDAELTSDFENARTRLLNDRFQAVLCVGGEGGLDLLTLARAYDEALLVMLMVDERSLDGVKEAIRMGATQYLLKPLSVPRVVDAIRDNLAKIELARAAKQRALIQIDDLTPALASAYLVLQPIVALGPEHRIFGYEALLRSNEPRLASPGAIFAAAERLGRIAEVGQRVRALAAKVAANLVGEALLFVNLHASELSDDQLFDIHSAFSGVAGRTVLEIAEGVDGTEPAVLEMRLASLRSMGFRIAVDDLGAGYAGLASFATLEPDYVKLDISLVRDIHTSSLKARIVKSVVALAQSVGVNVIAEGVEVDGELRCLRELGVRLVQGYLLGVPKPYLEGNLL
jgi:EAL domain-containing protein (putative c-di-GMP-specific phosphodiesterase class I)